MKREYLIVLLWLAGLSACDRHSQTPPPPSPAVTEPAATDFNTYLAASIEELQAKRSASDPWLQSMDRWDIDQAEGVIRWSNEDGMRAEAKAQIVGSWSKESQTWLWAWDNGSIADSLKADARRTRQFGNEHGDPHLATSAVECTRDEADAIASVAAKVCQSQGIYIADTAYALVFIAFDVVTLSNTNTQPITTNTLQQTATSRP